MTHVKNLPALLREKKDFGLQMLVGIDGFVDEIMHVVDKRLDIDNFVRLSTMKQFGDRIVRAAGYSTNIEMVPVQTKLGGNGPILANALIEYGANVTYVGALGSPEIHPIFQSMVKKTVKTYSLSNPGFTDAAEFDDGKFMIGKHGALKDLTWDAFVEGLGGLDAIQKLFCGQDMVAMVNWTMMPYMSQIWEGLIRDVFPVMKQEKPALAFFDLADPEKRTNEDIMHAMSLIGRFQDKFDTILGLNEKELYEIAEVYHVDKAALEDTSHTSLAVYEKLGIHCLVVHPVASALCVVGGHVYETQGPYCKKPVLTTGAGDNFNAGFVLGMTLGLDPMSCLTLGVVTSGFYVRNAKSPTFDDALQFAEEWAGGKYD